VNVLLVILLLASLLFAAAIIAPMLRHRRRVQRSPGAGGLIAAGQLLLGALWVFYGALYLTGKSHSRTAGIYLIIFGLLWCWQGVRRLAGLHKGGGTAPGP
jgi:hypothetical protein